MIVSEAFRACRTEQELNDVLKRDDIAAEIVRLKESTCPKTQISYTWTRNAWLYYRDLIRAGKHTPTPAQGALV